MQKIQEKIDYRDDILPLRHAFTSAGFVIGGKIISIIASFAAVTVLGNIVSKEIAGTYNFIIAIFTIISITTLPGMNTALVRAVAKGYDGTMTVMLRRRFLFGSIGTGIAIIIGTIYLLLGNHQLGIAMIIIAPFVPFTDTLSNFTVGFWQGKKDFRKSSLFGALYYVGFNTLNILVFLVTNNLWLLLIGVLSGQAIIGFFVFQSIKQENLLCDQDSIELGYHLSAMHIFKVIAKNSDRILVWYLAGPAMVAAYSFAVTPLAKLYQLIPVGSISLPHLSTHSFTRTIKNKIVNKVIFLFLITIPLVIIGIIITPTVYKFLFPQYPESIYYFQLLLTTVLFTPMMMIDAALTAFKKTRLLYITKIGSPLVKCVLMVGLGILFGITGIIFALIITSIIESIILGFLFFSMKTID